MLIFLGGLGSDLTDQGVKVTFKPEMKVLYQNRFEHHGILSRLFMTKLCCLYRQYEIKST